MTPSDRDCLALYDEGATRHPLDRALLLVAAAEPGVNWADQPLGRRDARLLALRCDWFGPRLDAVQACPACGQSMNLSVDLQALLRSSPAGDAGMPDGPADATVVEAAGARFRLVTTRDLAALAAGAPDVESAANMLLNRLALAGPPTTNWSPEQRATIEAALDATDPLAHVTLQACCEQCGHVWPAELDIAAALWAELADRAKDAIAQVHVLASAYGWSEEQVLTLTPARRQLYLQQVLA